MLHNIYGKLRRITSNRLYFPEIDGIRFVAIMWVLLFHIHAYFIAKTGIKFEADPSRYFMLNTFLNNGNRGVELFFVLSGFILCLPFARHYINGSKKPLPKKYYLRRLTRLEPPYLIALTATLLMQLLMHVHPPLTLLHSWLASLVYAHEAVYHRAPLVMVVAWSLEVEIQFYMIAPVLFRLLAWPVYVRRIVLVASIFIAIVLQNLWSPSFTSIYGFIQYFMSGILLCDFFVSNTLQKIFNNKMMVVSAFICFAVIIYLPINDPSYSPEFVFLSRIALPFFIGLFYYIIMKNDAVRKMFSYKFIPIIGGMCYSIYLLHYTIISIFGRITINWHFTHSYLLNLCLQTTLLLIPVLILSSIFYYYVERPFMSNKWLAILMEKGKQPGVVAGEVGKN